MAYAPPVTLHNYTNTHATNSNVPWSWTGLVPQCLVGLSASPRRCRWAALAGWVGSSCPPPLRGWGRTAPPLRGGSLPSACSLTSPRLSCACVGVPLGASVCGRLGMRDRVGILASITETGKTTLTPVFDNASDPHNQAYFLTSSTHTPTRDTYKTRHVGSAASVTKLIARSRSHGFPLSLRLDGLRPAGHSSQLHKHTRHPLERPLVLDGARASFGRAFCLPASLSLGCVGRLGWVFVSPAPMGAGANRPPFTGGQLTYGVPYGVLVDVLPPAARVRWRLRPSQRSRSRCRRRV